MEKWVFSFYLKLLILLGLNFWEKTFVTPQIQAKLQRQIINKRAILFLSDSVFKLC